MMARTWRWWVSLMDQREAPTSMALVRILLSLVFLWDLSQVAVHGLVVPLWATEQAGGFVNVYKLSAVPEVYRWLTPEQATLWGPTLAWTLWMVLMVSLASFGAGLLTRFSGAVFLMTYAQTSLINDTGDRAIDRMCRIVVILLILSSSHRTLSLDALWRTGRWLGDGALMPAWPRYLLIGQLILMYWCAGAEKFAMSWFPWGGYSALYIILQDPIMAAGDFSFLASPWLYWTTQLGTAVSHAWEWTLPLLLLAYYYRNTRQRPGRVRAAFNALDVRLGYVIVGVVFHIALALTLRLGIFPAAMLALYPAFFHPDELRALGRRLVARRPPPPEVSHVAP